MAQALRPLQPHGTWIDPGSQLQPSNTVCISGVSQQMAALSCCLANKQNLVIIMIKKKTLFRSRFYKTDFKKII